MSRKKNITVVASSLALGALLATGVSGVAMAAGNDNSSKASTSSASQGKHGAKDANGAVSQRDGKGGKGRGGDHGGPGIGRGQMLHSTATIKDASGKFVELASIEGSVTAVNASSISVKAEDGFTATYVINASTKVHTDAKKDATIADITVGENVEVRGTSASGTLTADHVHEETPKTASTSTN